MTPTPQPNRPHKGPRRRLNYGPGGREIPQPQKPNEIVESKCPRCDADLSVRMVYNAVICPECGWLLKTEPYWGSMSLDDVCWVADPAVPGGGQKVFIKLYVDGWRKIMENWKGRNLCEVTEETTPDGKKGWRVRIKGRSDMFLAEDEPIGYGARELAPGEEDKREDERPQDDRAAAER